MKTLFAAVIALILGIAAPHAIPNEVDVPVATTVRLLAPNGRAVCSGTVVNVDVVLTAEHCLPYVRFVESRDGVREIYASRSAEYGRDAALVFAEGVACPCAPMSMGLDGDAVRAVGYPSGVFSDSTGFVMWIGPLTELFPDFPRPDQIDIFNTAFIAPGSSGGGLWQQQGGRWVLVGVTVHGFNFWPAPEFYGATPLWTVPALLQ